MAVVGAILGLGAAVLVVLVVYLGWRDRNRQFSAEDPTASRVPTFEAERLAAEGNLRGPDKAAGFS
ncbi:hypothetical protein BDK92_0160 [Micromonospora pisi]|uniref:Uncharacterized protein n=1 Tax=Micromonospora pisi TaxID=589240 RepID=A0A495JC45_9ACTN|nr:hypothetical protein [Micromonospora pisi]RKR85942.1 hypothetical protein BDK92_0160 [Micromonospora pisi]